MRGSVAELRAALPPSVRRSIVRLRFRLRLPSARLRMLPGFLIIGAQRAGTSSLFTYLAQHPRVIRSLRKETEYFSRRYALGPRWYQAHFPLRWRGDAERAMGRPVVTFEATPDYLFHPYTARRVQGLLPEVRIVALLRNPIDRAFSHYRHMVRLGFETLPFENALKAEPARIASDLQALRRDPLHYSRNLLRFSYVARGLYADQLAEWMEVFDSHRFLILRSEDFFAEPGLIYDQVLCFLGLPGWRPLSFQNVTRDRIGSWKASALPAHVRDRLAEVFAPCNERLAALVGRRFGWDAPEGGGLRLCRAG